MPIDTASSTPEERASALTFLQALATEVSEGTIDLPCFPDVVIRISRALADPNVTPERVVIMVGAEPRLAARILQTANSAAFNVSGRPLAELRPAIVRLGHQMVQGTAMSYAMQHLKNEKSLRSIEKPLAELWSRSIAVASICRLVSLRTQVAPDEAFLAGLLHGIGNLYIMVRVASAGNGLGDAQSWMELVSGWHASIGKAVLESWGFADELCCAVGEQDDIERRRKHTPGLVEVLVASRVLADARKAPQPAAVGIAGSTAFSSVGLTPADCAAILIEAEEQIRQVHEALT